MNIRYVRDPSFRIMGSIETRGDGKQLARDHRLAVLGEYDPKADVTRDGRLLVIGQGNQLPALIARFYP